MQRNTRIAIAGLLSAAGSLLNAFAVEFGGATPPETLESLKVDAPATPEPAKPKKAKAEKPAPPVEEPAEAAPAATEEASATPTEEQYQKNRDLIAPLVKGGQGEDVKKVIKKYAGEDGTLKTMNPKHNAAFEKDIAALSY